MLLGRHFDGRDIAAGAPPSASSTKRSFVSTCAGAIRSGIRVVVRGMNTGGRPLPVREIVAVVAQVRQRPDELEGQPHVYAPIAQDPRRGLRSSFNPPSDRHRRWRRRIRAALRE